MRRRESAGRTKTRHRQRQRVFACDPLALWTAGGAGGGPFAAARDRPGDHGGASGRWVLPAPLFVETLRRRTSAVIVQVAATSATRPAPVRTRRLPARREQMLEKWIDTPAPSSADGVRRSDQGRRVTTRSYSACEPIQ